VEHTSYETKETGLHSKCHNKVFGKEICQVFTPIQPCLPWTDENFGRPIYKKTS
jgi:hypothetical protein